MGNECCKNTEQPKPLGVWGAQKESRIGGATIQLSGTTGHLDDSRPIAINLMKERDKSIISERILALKIKR